MIKKIFPLLTLFFLVTIVSGCNAQNTNDLTSQPKKQIEEEKMEKNLPSPTMGIDMTKSYEAVLKTDKGEITVSLDARRTPKTVNNFIYLARNNFYDNTVFHRVIKGFMIQGGDPNGDGTGGPGYRFEDEDLTGDYQRGVIAMANAGADTNGSQFFIMHQDYPLDKLYVTFGKVTKGMEVVDAIAQDKVIGESPEKPVLIKSIEIIEK